MKTNEIPLMNDKTLPAWAVGLPALWTDGIGWRKWELPRRSREALKARDPRRGDLLHALYENLGTRAVDLETARVCLFALIMELKGMKPIANCPTCGAAIFVTADAAHGRRLAKHGACQARCFCHAERRITLG